MPQRQWPSCASARGAEGAITLEFVLIFMTSILVLFAPAVVLYGWVGGLWTFIAIGLAEAITESYSEMGAQVLILEATGVEQAAMGTGVLEAIGLMMAAITALAGPPLYGQFGSRWLFGVWGVVCLLLSGIVMLRLKAVKTPSKGVRLSH